VVRLLLAEGEKQVPRENAALRNPRFHGQSQAWRAVSFVVDLR